MKTSYAVLFGVILFCLIPESLAANLTLLSPAFNVNTTIPKQYTCKGADISPPLFWQNPPTNTKSFVLIVDDPDAPSGDWVHWVLSNIPANTWLLSEATKTPLTAISGVNSWGESGYRGPCPPSNGGAHHYFFRLYALDTVLNLSPKANKYDVLKAMQNHIIETSELTGIYAAE